MRAVPYVNLSAQFAAEAETMNRLVSDVMASGMWVGGPAVDQLEQNLATYIGCREVVTVGSGTDALILGMKALDIGPGDEVITPPNSFVASTSAIIQTGAVPVFADVLPDQSLDPKKVREKITQRTKAIMPVHLSGRLAPMVEIMEIAREYNLRVIEDAAQSIGSKLFDRQAGTYGDIGCFSTHPLKNLNAMGDGGFVTTNAPEIATRIKRLRNNGLIDRNTVIEWGVVSRMDTLQAAILDERLKHLDEIITRRRAHAERYRALLDPKHVFCAPEAAGEFNTYHTFVIQVDRRDELQAYLGANNIGSAIHYPVPIHVQPAATRLGYKRGDFPDCELQAERILSLPINQTLSLDDIDHVAQMVNGFFK